MNMEYDARKKSVFIAYLALVFLGGLGVHRFYLNRGGSGAVQLGLTIGGLVLSLIGVGLVLLLVVGVWLFVDLFLVPGMVTEYNVALARSLQPTAAPASQGQLMEPRGRE
jgi:TM2 domain-containing membrane protein YozV